MSIQEWRLVENIVLVEICPLFTVSGSFSWYDVCGSQEQVCLSPSNLYLCSSDLYGDLHVESYPVPPNFPKEVDSFLRIEDILYVVTAENGHRWVIHSDLDGNVITLTLPMLPISIMDEQVVCRRLHPHSPVYAYCFETKALTSLLPEYEYITRIRGVGDGLYWHLFQQRDRLFAFFNFREVSVIPVEDAPFATRLQHNGALHLVSQTDGSTILIDSIWFPFPNTFIPERSEVSVDLSIFQEGGLLPQELFQLVLQCASPSGSIIVISFSTHFSFYGLLVYRWFEQKIESFIPTQNPILSFRFQLPVTGFVFINDMILCWNHGESFILLDIRTSSYQCREMTGFSCHCLSKPLFRRIIGQDTLFFIFAPHSPGSTTADPALTHLIFCCKSFLIFCNLDFAEWLCFLGLHSVEHHLISLLIFYSLMVFLYFTAFLVSFFAKLLPVFREKDVFSLLREDGFTE